MKHKQSILAALIKIENQLPRCNSYESLFTGCTKLPGQDLN